MTHYSVNVKPYINKDQLPLTNPCDALHRGEHAATANTQAGCSLAQCDKLVTKLR